MFLKDFINVSLVIPTPITGTINASTTALPCEGDSTASITITGVSGGEGSNYLYVLTNTITGISTAPQTSNVFNDFQTVLIDSCVFSCFSLLFVDFRFCLFFLWFLSFCSGFLLFFFIFFGLFNLFARSITLSFLDF